MRMKIVKKKKLNLQLINVLTETRNYRKKR